MGYGKTVCKVCKESFQKRCANHQVCDTCYPEHHRMDNVLRLRKYREKRGVKRIGSILKCSDCGKGFKYRAANQHRCDECQRKYNVQQIHRWISADKIRQGTYRRNAKENYYYSGNRIPAHERDGCKCVKCGSTHNLNLHHIDGRGKGFPKGERNDSLENLTTLCSKCHQILHVITEKRLYAVHPETVQEVYDEFLH